VTGERPQTWFEDLVVGDELPTVDYPLSVYRLVMAAGANRDLNSIHHNTEVAQASGAPEMYANTFMLLGMWERAVRDHVGPGATLTAVRGFRMKKFNVVGDTTRVCGRVASAQRRGEVGVVELEVWCENSSGVTVGPGTVVVELPARPAATGPTAG
jgi:acyl dehydratase